MRTTSLPGDSASDFGRAVAALHDVRLRPEVRLTDVPAPSRIAPYAVALTADVLTAPGSDDELATGRFVLLHDPASPEPWDGTWRAVTFARAQLEPEFGADPLLGEVGWSWFVEALNARGIAFASEAGTVTRVVSESFGGLSDRPASVELEIRASWTPWATDSRSMADHLVAWGDLLCTIAGLPPLPEGVVPLPGPRR